MNESNKPRQARMDRGKSRIIFCPLRDDLPRYSVRQHHSSKETEALCTLASLAHSHSDGSVSVLILIVCESVTLDGRQHFAPFPTSESVLQEEIYCQVGFHL